MSIEFHVSAELRPWPAKKELAACLQAAGLQISVGIYSIRIKGSSFIFQEYGGDLGDPMLVSDALNLTEMINDASWLSEALTKADLTHRIEVFEVSADGETMVAHFHYKC